MIVKILQIIVVAFVFIVGASEANGETVTLVNRRLLSDANLGRKDNLRANDQKGSLINGHKGAFESGESKTSAEGNQNKNTDGKFGVLGIFDDSPASSTSSSHHYYRDQVNPPSPPQWH
ncbi:hypothetical protein RHMOL_Rhmol04G0374500 [Rhododendron molle]|uniref:Uncharacterized protein n=1 Tax=Rhododendron molle TaxID=49168 RepID=A0ACC0P839_RHOML|nr:hypothetical protein RHMOL_Rhmol04G0374500 [Rhododendron molle]